MHNSNTQENQLPQLIPRSMKFKHPRHRSVHDYYELDHQIQEHQSLQKQYYSQKPRKSSNSTSKHLQYPRVKTVKNSEAYRQYNEQKSPCNMRKQIKDKGKLEKLYRKKWELKHRLERLNTQLVSIRQLNVDIDHINKKMKKSIERQRYQQSGRINLSRKKREQENCQGQGFKQENYKEKNIGPVTKGKIQKKATLKNKKDLVQSDQPHKLHHRCLQCCKFSLNKEDIALKNIKDLQQQKYSVESEDIFQPHFVENSQKSKNLAEQNQYEPI